MDNDFYQGKRNEFRESYGYLIVAICCLLFLVGIVISCLKLSMRENKESGMAAPHFQLNGIVYVYQGELADELPEGYVYTGVTSDGTVKGEVYVNPDSLEQVYFWLLGGIYEKHDGQRYLIFRDLAILSEAMPHN